MASLLFKGYCCTAVIYAYASLLVLILADDINDCDYASCGTGSCSDGDHSHTCDCTDTGYTGLSCETKCPSNCKNCLNNGPGGCDSCDDGYSLQPDQTCSAEAADRCASNPCNGHGTCSNGDDSYTCSCDPGFRGISCEINIDDCEQMPCTNGGSCTDGDNSYVCSCAAGYAGTNCQLDIDDCNPNPCNNGGSCIDGVNSHTCSCSTGYTGTTCESPYTCIMSDCSTCLPGAPPTCSQCRPGHGTPTPTDRSHCFKCSSRSGCAQCNDLTQCTLCAKTDLAPRKDGSGTCALCASNCKNCLNNGPGKCDSCTVGYYLQPDQTCAACSVNNCQTCTSTECTFCKSGYALDTSKIPATCSACGYNCIFCQANPGKCDPGFCKAGYTFMDDNKSCIKWTKREKCYTPGSTPYPQAKTQQHCMSVCFLDILCFAFEFNGRSAGCSIHYHPFSTWYTISNVDVDQYLITRNEVCGDNCLYCQANPGKCDLGYCKAGYTFMDETQTCVSCPQCVTWKKYEKFYTLGSVPFTQAKTLQDCMSTCVADIFCTAFEYNAKSAGCSMHFQPYTIWFRILNADIDQYVITRN
jgi:hypothetical protein